MAENQDSDYDFLAMLLDFDLSRLPAVDEPRLQSEIDRLTDSVSSRNQKYICDKQTFKEKLLLEH